ncbi:MAG: hypothetical protein AAF598_13630, partial [Bacteroidota bacterium]
YRDFMNGEEAEHYINLLDEANIPYKVEGTGVLIDTAIVGNTLLPKVILKLKRHDFKNANRLFANPFKDKTYADFKGNYLDQFTDEELKEILLNPDEWSVENVEVARIILRGRGIHLADEKIEAYRTEKFETLRTGKAADPTWMTIYFCCILGGIFTSPFVTLAGLGMVYFYGFGQSNDPDGQPYYHFDQKTRKIGRLLFYVGLPILIGEIVYLVYAMYPWH